MNSIRHITLNFNKNISISYHGGNLSSDTGLLIPRSFDQAIGFLNSLKIPLQKILLSNILKPM